MTVVLLLLLLLVIRRKVLVLPGKRIIIIPLAVGVSIDCEQDPLLESNGYSPGEPLRSGRGTVGKCTGPKWPKMVKTTILVKIPYSELEFSVRKTKMDQNGPFWVHFGLKRPFWSI